MIRQKNSLYQKYEAYHSGNIHTHIVINSLRIEDVPLMPYMDRACDTKAGMKHRCTQLAYRSD